jgi:two-component system chemotaxis response regulator CheB
MPDAPAVGIPFDELPIVAIGASTGGPASLGEILSLLPADLRACLLIVQHMPPGYTADLAYCLDQRAAIHVVEGRDGDELKAGVAFIAPGGQHMQVKNRRIHLSTAARVNMQRPSVDVLFESLVPFAGRVHAILLSGMGQDGVAGMSRLHQAGAVTIVQDEATSIVWGMPGAAVKAGCVSAQLPPTGMARHLLAKVQQSSSPAKPHDTAAPSATHETRVNG